MTEQEYKDNFYPGDFVLVGQDFLPLPKGGKLQITTKEIAKVFTAADGTKRKDVIRRYKSVSLKYPALLEEGFEVLQDIIQKIEDSFYGQRKMLYIKKQTMPAEPGLPITPCFQGIKIDITSPLKYGYAFRRNGMFVYSGISLKIN